MSTYSGQGYIKITPNPYGPLCQGLHNIAEMEVMKLIVTDYDKYCEKYMITNCDEHSERSNTVT